MGGALHSILGLSARLLLAWWILCSTGALPARSQDAPVALDARSTERAPSTGSADRIATNIQVDANLVLVQVLVTDRKDHVILGLGKEDFKLYDEHAERVITHFASEAIPVSVGIVFDCSRSMASKLRRSRAAVHELLNTANREDEFSLIKFSDRPQILAHFPARSEEIQSRLMSVEPEDTTALLDAIHLSLEEMRYAAHARKAILIISDGGDNCSRYTPQQINKAVKEADVQIYSIGIVEPPGRRSSTPEELKGPALLHELARRSGGQFFQVDNPDALPEAAARIGTALHSEYVLGYAPPPATRDGKYHRLQVKLTRRDGGPRLRAHFRPGYYAPAQ